MTERDGIYKPFLNVLWIEFIHSIVDMWIDIGMQGTIRDEKLMGYGQFFNQKL
ncbi:hypothetical protein HK1_01989 [Tepidibacillus sp. HK-1]|nr:hypothetical protein HK1_01989 [Tepidibacillus sp. HK-1]